MAEEHGGPPLLPAACSGRVRIAARVDAVLSRPLGSKAGFAELEAPVLTAAVAGLARLESRVAALKAAATDAALTTGAVRSSGAANATQWLVETGGGSARKARRTAGRASRLKQLPDTARALSAGELTAVSTWM